jgi:crotonobetainyl-CoA:carnitine CoA-transferase CaiB-like acyl-CoA transferase
VKHRQPLSEMLNAVFGSKGADEWVALLEAADIPVGRILTVNEVVAHPQLQARGKITQVQHPVAGELKFVGNPLPQAKAQSTPPPLLGEHTREVLRRRLGFVETEIDALIRDGVVRANR